MHRNRIFPALALGALLGLAACGGGGGGEQAASGNDTTATTSAGSNTGADTAGMMTGTSTGTTPDMGPAGAAQPGAAGPDTTNPHGGGMGTTHTDTTSRP